MGRVVETAKKGFPLGAFQAALDAWEAHGIFPLLIGGQAVNFWATRYLDEEPELRALSRKTAFTSRDIDFKGDLDTARKIATALGKKLVTPRFGEQAFSKLVGFIPFEIGGAFSNIEIVFSVEGLDKVDADKLGVRARFGATTICVLEPISLLYSKAYNVQHYDQTTRGDIAHLRILVPCVRAFLRDSLKSVGSRATLSAMERAMTLAQSERGKQMTKRHGIQWEGVLPAKEIEASLDPKLRMFRERRLPDWLNRIRSWSSTAAPRHDSC